MIHIVDYGVGNIQAHLAVFQQLDVVVTRATTATQLCDATHIILPGVGSFDNAMSSLNRSGLRSTLDELVLVHKRPVLGVCVGMQMLGDSSEEGVLPGLGWVSGKVKSFRSNSTSDLLPLPHMGWNDLQIRTPTCELFNGLNDNPKFYFLHSFYFEALNATHVAATTQYAFDFDCVVAKENIFGVQFHPEKSHHVGAQLLKNFSGI